MLDAITFDVADGCVFAIIGPNGAGQAFDPAKDVESLVALLADNTFPFHSRPRATEAQAREDALGGRFWSNDCRGFWVHADGGCIGIAVIDDLADIAHGGNPVFDLRLAERHRAEASACQR